MLIALFYVNYVFVAPWCGGYHNYTTSFIKTWTQALRRLKSCSRLVGDSQWWESLTVVPAGNKATPFVGQSYDKISSSSSSSSSSLSSSSSSSPYFQQRNLGHRFSQVIHRFKIGIFCVGLRIDFQVFPN